MRTKTRHSPARSGFTLIEFLGVLTILAILAGMLVFPFYGLLERARLSDERETLEIIAKEIKESFRRDDFTLNVSALRGEIPAEPITVQATVFDYDMDGGYFREGWYARIARLRGQDIASITTWENARGIVKDVAFNRFKNRRLLLVGPSYNIDENRNVQTYLLLSFMFSLNEDVALAFPSGMADANGKGNYSGDPSVSANHSAYGQWYRTLYEHDWGDVSAAPAGWDSVWNEKGATGLTFAQKVLAVKIVQPRHRFTVNNQSVPTPVQNGPSIPAESVFVYSNVASEGYLGHANYQVAIPPQESLIRPDASSMGILEGRRVFVRRGGAASTPAAQTRVFSLILNEHSTFTIQ